MNINMLLWWSLGRGNTVVPSRWQATPAQVADAMTGDRLRQLASIPAQLRVSKRATPATVSTTSVSICSMHTRFPFAQKAVQ
jgi:hypothetical protein